jgi:hypothetical protein
MSLLTRMPTVVSTKLGRSLLIGQKHSPTILFAGGVVGFIATTVLTARATMHLEVTLEETRLDLDLSLIHI